MTFIFLAIVIAVAYATYRWIELPGQRKARALMQQVAQTPVPTGP